MNIVVYIVSRRKLHFVIKINNIHIFLAFEDLHGYNLNDCKINELSPRSNQALSFLENLRRQNPKKLVCYHAVIGFSFKHYIANLRGMVNKECPHI